MSAIDRCCDRGFNLAGRQTKAAGQGIKNFRVDHNVATRQVHFTRFPELGEIRNSKLYFIHSQRAAKWFVTRHNDRARRSIQRLEKLPVSNSAVFIEQHIYVFKIDERVTKTRLTE